MVLIKTGTKPVHKNPVEDPHSISTSFSSSLSVWFLRKKQIDIEFVSVCVSRSEERKIVGLKKRIEELRSELNFVNAELETLS